MRQKTLLLTCLLTVMCISTVSAQLKVGVRGGYNITQMSTSSSVLNVSNRDGYYIGPTIKAVLPILGLGIDASVLYDRREAVLSSEDNKVNQSINEENLAIPLNLRLTIGSSKSLSLFAYGGPQYSYNIGAKKQGSWEWKDYTKSMNIGAGVTILEHVQLNVNYNFRFDSSGEEKFWGKGKTHCWQLGGAYYF